MRYFLPAAPPKVLRAKPGCRRRDRFVQSPVR